MIPVKPTDHGEAKERYVKRFNFNQPSFFDHAEIHHPNEGGDERSIRAETRPRHGDKCERDGEHREDRRQTGRPFVSMSGYGEREGYEPIYQRRLSIIRFSTNLRHEPVAR